MRLSGHCLLRPGWKLGRPGSLNSEMELLLAEIGKLGGTTRRLPSARAIPAALRELVEAETIRKAMVWETPELQPLGVADSICALWEWRLCRERCPTTVGGV